MLRVLTYHRVADPAATPGLDPSLVSATPDEFRRQMRHLAARYDPLDLGRVLDAFGSGRPLPRRPVLVTFDDAYRDFGEVAWPILRELRIPATVFVPTDFPGRTDRAFWWDRLHRALQGRSAAGRERGDGAWEVEARGEEAGDGRSTESDLPTFLKTLPPDTATELVDRFCRESPPGPPAPDRSPVLGWGELRTLVQEGVDVGSHTRTHAALVHATDGRIREELRRSMETLRERIGDVSPTVCYPYGLHDPRVVRIAREEGFELGFTNVDGLSRPGETDPLRIRRTNITRRTSPLVFRLRMQPWFARIDRWRHRHERAPRGSAACPGGSPG